MKLSSVVFILVLLASSNSVLGADEYEFQSVGGDAAFATDYNGGEDFGSYDPNLGYGTEATRVDDIEQIINTTTKAFN